MQRETRVNWESTDSCAPPEPHELHVWHVALGQHLCRPEWLETSEGQRHQDIKASQAAHRYCASRSALRYLLAQYLGTQPDEVELVQGKHGKPRLRRGSAPLTFNLSHSRDSALFAFGHQQDVGIDVEILRELPDPLTIARRVMDNAEIEELQAADSDAFTFLHLWTRMEARQKCLGQGVFGERVCESQIGLYSFYPADEQLACVAWSDPKVTPRMRFLQLEAF